MSKLSPSVKRNFQQSPNCNQRNTTKRSITIHWWNLPSAGANHGGTVSWLMNPAAQVSAHYVVSANRVTQLVKEAHRAWHAGSNRGNDESVGLELSPYATEGDYQTAAELIADIRSRLGNLPLVPHNSWTSTRCPGDWDLAKLDRMARAVAVGKPASSGATPPKPTAPASGGAWPASNLTVGPKHTAASHNAWMKLLGDVGHTGTVAQRIQKHLRQRGYYKGGISAQSRVGPQTTTALQRFLADRGFYKNRIDGSRGPQTIRAEMSFLNDQRRYY